MKTELIRKSLELTSAQFKALDDLAQQFELTPGVGPTPKRPSWRILIREIATGKLTITRKEVSS